MKRTLRINNFVYIPSVASEYNMNDICSFALWQTTRSVLLANINPVYAVNFYPWIS